MYVKFLGLVDVVTDSVEEDGRDEFLSNVRFGGDKDPGASVDSIWGPGVWLRKG